LRTSPSQAAAGQSADYRSGGVAPSPAGRLWSLDEIEAQLSGIARPQEKPLISRLFSRLRSRLGREGGAR
jgi:hypothetical protein